MRKNEFILYGLSKHKEIIDKIIQELNVFHDSFDIRLILTEALTNAYKHGNNSREDKPIFLRYILKGENVKFEIKDSGSGFKNITIQENAADGDLLNDSGRGLFLISCVADEIEMRNNVLIIQKQINFK